VAPAQAKTTTEASSTTRKRAIRFIVFFLRLR
jgi:hypothetical protein